MNDKSTVRYRATQAADKALVKAWNERGGRFGEDGPVAIIDACIAYDKVISRALMARARKDGHAAVMREYLQDLGKMEREEKVW